MRRKTLSFLILSIVFLSAFSQESTSSIPLDSLSVEPTLEGRKVGDFLYKAMFKETTALNNVDSLTKLYDNLPSFSIYKNNYIVTGTTLRGKPNENNSDAKFQISFMQKLTNSILPFKFHLFLTYTQLAFWDIYKDSFPFADINFNPTIGMGRVLTHKNRFLGVALFQLEHESNGRDGENSRSWNKVSAGSLLVLNDDWTLQAKLWMPFVGGGNPHLTTYKGYGHLALDYHKDRIHVGMLATSRGGAFFDYNISANFSYKLFPKENQHLYIQYYSGYGENLLNYTEYRHRLRIGFIIEPSFLRFY